MKRRSWSDEEIEFIRQNISRMSYVEMGRILGRSPATVCYKAADIGLRRGTSEKWTDEEIDFLREHYRTMTYRQIGASIGRSPHAVQAMARWLGLQKGPDRPRPKKVADIADRRRLETLRMELLRRMDICAACVAEWGIPPGFDGFSYRHKLERQRCPRCVVSAETREIVEEMEAIQRAIRVKREREREKSRDRRLSGE